MFPRKWDVNVENLHLWEVKSRKKSFLVLSLMAFFVVGALEDFLWVCWRFVGMRVGRLIWVNISKWNYQFDAPRQSGLDIIKAACYVVKQVNVYRTSLPAHKGEVWWVSSPFQIWVHWLNARVSAAPQDLYCSPLSTETATPSVNLQNIARTAPVEVSQNFNQCSQIKF